MRHGTWRSGATLWWVQSAPELESSSWGDRSLVLFLFFPLYFAGLFRSRKRVHTNSQVREAAIDAAAALLALCQPDSEAAARLLPLMEGAFADDVLEVRQAARRAAAVCDYVADPRISK